MELTEIMNQINSKMKMARDEDNTLAQTVYRSCDAIVMSVMTVIAILACIEDELEQIK